MAILLMRHPRDRHAARPLTASARVSRHERIISGCVEATAICSVQGDSCRHCFGLEFKVHATSKCPPHPAAPGTAVCCTDNNLDHGLIDVLRV